MLQALYSELLTYCNFCSISRSNDFIYSSFSMAVLHIPLDLAINVNFPAYLSTELFSALKSFSNLLFFSFHVKSSSSTSFFLSDILAVSFTLLFSSRDYSLSNQRMLSNILYYNFFIGGEMYFMKG